MASSSSLLVALGLGLSFFLLAVWFVWTTTASSHKVLGLDSLVALAKSSARVKHPQFSRPFVLENKKSLDLKGDMKITLPIKLSVLIPNFAVNLAYIPLNDSLYVVLDTGSTNLLVTKNATLTSISKFSTCKTFMYGAGTSHACLGHVQVADMFTKTKSLAAEIVSSVQAEKGDAPPTNIAGLMPGLETNPTSIVRQLGLTSICLDFGRQLATFERQAGRNTLENKQKIAAVNPVISSTSFLTIVPWKVTWLWNDGSTSTWQQWMNNEKKPMACTGQTRNADQNMSPFLFLLDTGTTWDITSLLFDSNGKPQESKSELSASIVTRRTCVSVTLTVSAFDPKLSEKGLSNRAVLADYLFPPQTVHEEKPSVTYTFQLIPEFQEYGVTHIPSMLPNTTGENIQYVVLGLNALCCRPYQKMKMHFASSDKNSTPLGVEFS